MKIDFSFQLSDLISKKPMTEADGRPITLGIICTQALMAQTEDDKGLSGEDKVKAFVLGAKIIDGGEIEITAEEAALLKKRVAICYGPLIVGQCWPVLDGKPTPRISLVAETAKEVANG